MQGITRNPLADPGLLGVNAGASFGVVLAIAALGVTSPLEFVWFGLFGAAAVSILVYVLGSLGRGGATPVRLALAGAALSALLFAPVSALVLLDRETLDVYRHWVVGSLAGASEGLAELWPLIVAGLGLAWWASSWLNALALGEDTARSLGTRLGLTRTLVVAAVTLLCGTAVAIAGPIAFVGLVVPHLARGWCGSDQRWLLPYSALLGAILLLTCDVAGRVVARPGEIQVGIMVAAIGGPAFVFLVRRVRMAEL